MYLLIDLSVSDIISLSLFDENERFDFAYDGRNRELLEAIDSFLQKHDYSAGDLKGIMTVVGTGSFTNTRISASTANIWGLVLKIPIMAISAEQSASVQKLISKLNNVPVGRYVSAKYSAEPNIGHPLKHESIKT